MLVRSLLHPCRHQRPGVLLYCSFPTGKNLSLFLPVSAQDQSLSDSHRISVSSKPASFQVLADEEPRAGTVEAAVLLWGRFKCNPYMA